MNNVAVSVNTVQAVVDTTTNIVSYSTVVHNPITTGSQGPQGIPGISSSTTISQLYDTDLAELSEGSILIYRATDNMWAATTQLTNQAIDCGEY